MRIRLATLALLLAVASSATAQRAPAPATPSASGFVKEFGTMWTFDAPPLEHWKRTYGFAATPEWLERVRLSAIRIPGCSASLVSANGLVMTNHHCASECIEQLSTGSKDMIAGGLPFDCGASRLRSG